MATTTVAGRKFDLDRPRVETALAGVLPEPVHEHYVIIGGRRWPPKQVLALITGIDRADFTTHQARRILVRLGFPAARVHVRHVPPGGARHSAAEHPAAEHAAAEHAAAPRTGTQNGADTQARVEALRPFIGQWVAVRDDDVLVAAPSPRDVVAWLTQHGQRAQSVFRVPADESEIMGAAPR